MGVPWVDIILGSYFQTEERGAENYPGYSLVPQPGLVSRDIFVSTLNLVAAPVDVTHARRFLSDLVETP